MSRFSLWRALVALAACACFGTAWAQCTPSPDTSQVTVPDYLAVYYLHFRSQPAQDEVLFYGGVCVTAVGGEWTVIADEVTVTGLEAELGLKADSPELIWGELRMTADHLSATTERLELVNATLVGPDYSGRATSIDLDLVSGEMSLSGLTLNGAAFAVTGESAMLIGEKLTVLGPDVTTCIGLETPPYAIEGTSATVDLTTRSVELNGGMLRVGAVRIPLRASIELTEESLETFTLPVRVQSVDDRGDPSRPGTGIGARVVGLPLGEGASFDVGATGLDAEHQLGLVALVHTTSEESGTAVDATFGVEGSAPLLDIDVTKALTPWLDLLLSARTGADPGEDAQHEGLLGLEAEVPVPAIGGSVGGSVFTAATAIAPAGNPTETTLFGTRVGAAVELEASTGRTPFGTFAVASRAEATLYPRQDTWQWGVRLNPNWRLEVAPVTATLGYETWLTNSGSPFADVDRRLPLSRTSASVRVVGELQRWEEAVLTGRLGLRATHDGVPVGAEAPGYQTALADVGLEYRVVDWTVDGSVTAQVAGLLSPASGRDAYVTYVVEARRAGWPVLADGPDGPIVPHGSFALRAEALQGLLGPTGLRRLELSTALPIAFRNLELRPFIGFDVAPLLVSGARPELSVHGLDLTFVTCCGSLTVGYQNERGDWSASFSIDLERRP